MGCDKGFLEIVADTWAGPKEPFLRKLPSEVDMSLPIAPPTHVGEAPETTMLYRPSVVNIYHSTSEVRLR